MQRQESKIEVRAREKLDWVIGWLLDGGFGADWHTTERLPVWLRDELAVKLSGIEGVSVGEADEMLRVDQSWEDDA